MPRLMLANQPSNVKRRVYFDLRAAADGLTPATQEAGGQPQISLNGAAWTSEGIGTLVAIGHGRYYAELDQATVAQAGHVIQTRFHSAMTVDTPGDTVQVVAFDPDDPQALGLARLDAALSSRASPLDAEAACLAALILLGLDHLLAAPVSGSDVADDSLAARLVSRTAPADWDSFDPATDSLEALRDRGDAAWRTAQSVAVAPGGITWESLAPQAITAQALAPECITAETLAAAAAEKIADALLERPAIDGKSVRAALQIVAATTAGRVTGAQTGTEVFRGLDGSTPRVTVVVDAAGNRTDVTYS
jgi:hypothetical protein